MPIDPSDPSQVAAAEALAHTAGSTRRAIDEAARGYSVDPGLPAAISSGAGIAVTGVNAGNPQATPQVILAGSVQAAEVVQLTSLPLVGAGYPSVQTTAQLAQRFDGLNSGVADSNFPTAQ